MRSTEPERRAQAERVRFEQLSDARRRRISPSRASLSLWPCSMPSPGECSALSRHEERRHERVADCIARCGRLPSANSARPLVAAPAGCPAANRALSRCTAIGPMKPATCRVSSPAAGPKLRFRWRSNLRTRSTAHSARGRSGCFGSRAEPALPAAPAICVPIVSLPSAWCPARSQFLARWRLVLDSRRT